MRRRTRTYRLVVALAALAFWLTTGASGCKESLPTYEDPTNLVHADLTMKYLFDDQNNAMQFQFDFTNRFDETLQAKPVCDGMLTVTWSGRAGKTKSIPVRIGSLATPKFYDPITGILTINPGETASFSVFWDFGFNDGTSIPTLATYGTDPGCTVRLVSESILLNVEFSMKLFDKTEVITLRRGPIPFTHYYRWVKCS